MPLEEYLKGVVPSEMPSKWNMEALKAQAIAARSYAVATSTAGKHASKGFDLVDTTADQAYGGASSETPQTTRAVLSTRGEVLTYDNKIIPAYYNQDKDGISKEWMTYMKNSIKSTGGKYSTARMVCDYVNDLYMPLANLRKEYFLDLENVAEFTDWKKKAKANWANIQILQDRNVDNARLVAGTQITVNCEVYLPNIEEENADMQVYFGQFLNNGTVRNVYTVTMNKVAENKAEHKYTYEATLDLKTGGNFGYTFRVMPKHKMLVDSENLDLVKWITK